MYSSPEREVLGLIPTSAVSLSMKTQSLPEYNRFKSRKMWLRPDLTEELLTGM